MEMCSYIYDNISLDYQKMINYIHQTARKSEI